jgi:hypothetical protein
MEKASGGLPADSANHLLTQGENLIRISKDGSAGMG